VSPSILTFRIQKLRRWFTNNAKPGATTKGTMARPAKKPCATNVLEVFAKENKDTIVEKTKHLAKSACHKAAGGMLVMWKEARQAMFDALDPNTKARYESQVAKLNERSKLPPDAREIYMCVIFELLQRRDTDINNLSSTVTKQLSYRRLQGHYCPCLVGIGASVGPWSVLCKRHTIMSKMNSQP